MPVFEDNKLNNLDLTEQIESILAQLNSISRMADDYLAEIDDNSLNFVKKMKTSTSDRIGTLYEDLTYNEDKISKAITDIENKVMSAGSVENVVRTRVMKQKIRNRDAIINIPTDALSSVLSDELYKLKNATTDSIMQYMNMDSNGTQNVDQNSATQFIGSVEKYSKDIIEGMNVEGLFKKADELLNYQSIFNESNISKDLIDNLDFWSDDLNNLKSIFKLDDFGNFSKENFTNTTIQEVLNDFGHGQLMNEILPSNFNELSEGIIKNLRGLNNETINNLLNQLPTNFEDMIPAELMQNFGDPMLSIYGEVKNLINLGETLPTDLINSFSQFPDNIMDCLKISQGQITAEVQTQLTSMIDGIKNLDFLEMQDLLNKTNIQQYLNTFGDLDSLKEIISRGDLSQLTDMAGDLSGMTKELMSNITNLPR